jgi:hypothetical protein
MGYDFVFVSFREGSRRTFPLQCSAIREEDLQSDLRWVQFRDWLLARGGRINGKESSVWLAYGKYESINFNCKPTSIYLDTHAGWRHVLAAFRALRRLNKDACVFDCTTGTYHDERTFRDFAVAHLNR